MVNYDAIRSNDLWRWTVHCPQQLPPPAPVNLSDCKTGPSEIQIGCLKDMGLTEQDVLDLNAGWREVRERLFLRRFMLKNDLFIKTGSGQR
jgi:hypothetical protein